MSRKSATARRNSAVNAAGTDTTITPQGLDYPKLKEHLECPICLDLLFPPVFQCVTGHMFCNVCSKKILKCEICQKPITGTRNFFYEKCFEALQLPCKFIQQGCKETILGSDYEKHLKECEFRDVPCLDGGGWCRPIRRNFYIHHFRDVHKGMTVQVDEDTGKAVLRIPIPSAVTPGNSSYELFYKGLSFFFRIRKRDASIGMFLAIFGTPADASQFGARIMIGETTSSDHSENNQQDKNPIRQSWEGPVQTIHADPDEVMNNGLAFITVSTCLKAVATVKPAACVCDMRFSAPLPQWKCTIQILDKNKSLCPCEAFPALSLNETRDKDNMDYDTDDSL